MSTPSEHPSEQSSTSKASSRESSVRQGAPASAHKPPALGKPASYGDFVLTRRMQLIDEMGPFGGGRLLDVGCGNGAQTMHLLPRFKSIVGLDVVREHLEAFEEQLRSSRHADCRTVLYDGNVMPFEDVSFDAMISIETLEHVADEDLTLREMHRVLRPGGTLVLSVPNKWWIFETHGADMPGFSWVPWNRVPFFSWLPPSVHGRFARARIYTRRRIVELLRLAGFRIRDARYMTAPMDVVKNEKLARSLRNTIFRGASTPIPMLSTSVFVMARR